METHLQIISKHLKVDNIVHYKHTINMLRMIRGQQWTNFTFHKWKRNIYLEKTHNTFAWTKYKIQTKKRWLHTV